MPRALAVPVRQVLLRRWQRGQTASEIAAALALAPRTVRHLTRLFRQGALGPTALGPSYAPCGGTREWPEPRVYAEALELRRQHLGWGAGLIRVLLKEHWPEAALPGERTLRRWFRRAGLGRAPAGRRPRGSARRAEQPHEVWQMDAVEQLRLRDGQRASWLRLTDEFTGAVLFTHAFPIGRWAEVSPGAVQGQLRKAFTTWGRPQRVRVDNGPPWGSTGGWPTALALWLLGLGVDVSWNRPRRPKENAVIERTQGVSQRWVEPSTCANVAELQRRLDRMDRVQREQYPSIEGRSRREAFPRLVHSPRGYSLAWEKAHWSLGRVLECLAEYVLRRRVDRGGKVWLYDRGHWVGRAWAGEEVYVTIDPWTRQWVFQDASGEEIRRLPARELTREGIVGLSVGRAPRHRSRLGKSCCPD